MRGFLVSCAGSIVCCSMFGRSDCHNSLRRPNDLTLVTMRKPGEQFTWDGVNFKSVPEYGRIPQCVTMHLLLFLSSCKS